RRRLPGGKKRLSRKEGGQDVRLGLDTLAFLGDWNGEVACLQRLQQNRVAYEGSQAELLRGVAHDVLLTSGPRARENLERKVRSRPQGILHSPDGAKAPLSEEIDRFKSAELFKAVFFLLLAGWLGF